MILLFQAGAMHEKRIELLDLDLARDNVNLLMTEHIV